MRWTTVALALVIAACAQESDVPLAAPTTTTEPDTTEAQSDSLEPLWSVEDVHVVSEPVEVTGVVVVYLADEAERSIALVGYDPETGEELWRRPSTASQSTAGVVVHVEADDGRVFHLTPGENGDVVEAVDVETGEPQWTSPESEDGFNNQVRFCDRTRNTVCTIAGGAGLWELDAGTGELLTPSGLIGRPRQEDLDGRQLGPNLYELYDSGDIALIEDGQVVWQKPPSELFGGNAVNPDHGWSFRPADDLIVGWLGSQEFPENGELELAPQYSAGIDRATGETRWVEEGMLACGLNELELRVGGQEPWLRCAVEGTVTAEDYEVVGSDATAVLEGFDPATGTAEWSVDLGGLPLFRNDDQVMARLDETSFALSQPDGGLIGVDVGDGSILDVTEDDVGWCLWPNEYEYETSRFDFRTGAPFTTPCNLAGERREVPAEADEDMGIVVGDVFVWMDEAGLHGARMAD